MSDRVRPDMSAVMSATTSPSVTYFQNALPVVARQPNGGVYYGPGVNASPHPQNGPNIYLQDTLAPRQDTPSSHHAHHNFARSQTDPAVSVGGRGVNPVQMPPSAPGVDRYSKIAMQPHMSPRSQHAMSQHPPHPPQMQYANMPKVSSEAQMRMVRRNMGNSGVLRVLDLIDVISLTPHDQLVMLDYWRKLVAAKFLLASFVTIDMTQQPRLSPKSTTSNNTSTSNTSTNSKSLETALPNSSHPNIARLANLSNYKSVGSPYRLSMATLPRFLLATATDSDVYKLSLSLSKVACQMSNSSYITISGRSTVHYKFTDGSQLVVNADFRVQLNRDLRITFIECNFIDYLPSMDLASLEQVWKASAQHHHNNPQVFFNLLSEKCFASRRQHVFGLGETATRLLKLSDSMIFLRPIITVGIQRRITSPHTAMEVYVASAKNNMYGNAPALARRLDSMLAHPAGGTVKGAEAPDNKRNSGYSFSDNSEQAPAPSNKRRK